MPESWLLTFGRETPRFSNPLAGRSLAFMSKPGQAIAVNLVVLLLGVQGNAALCIHTETQEFWWSLNERGMGW